MNLRSHLLPSPVLPGIVGLNGAACLRNLLCNVGKETQRDHQPTHLLGSAVGRTQL
jgi:hypothetical protein